MNSQEVFNLRESDWKGLPPPPVFMTGEPNSAGADPAATPVITSLGLPSRDLESQIAHPPPFEPVFALEMDASPRSPASHSPSISIASISDFTAADTFDDEPPLDSTAITAHGAFYFEDGNVEVLCNNTLFRVHTSVLSLHSPVLGRMFTKANLATAESPNGCPRILSSEAATDFTTLLKIIYLPTYAALLIPLSGSSNHPSPGSLNGIKYRVSPHSRPSSRSRRSTRYPASDLRCSTSSVMHTQRLLGG